jgi:hypothetical protein
MLQNRTTAYLYVYAASAQRNALGLFFPLSRECPKE